MKEKKNLHSLLFNLDFITMKKKLLYAFSAFLLSGSMMAQEVDITPSRYKFSNQPAGPFTINYVNAGANPPASLAAVVDNFDNGFLMLAGGPAVYTGNGCPAQAAVQAGVNVVDLGGTVGKVLCINGASSKYDNAPKMSTSVANLGWFNLNFYTDKKTTPINQKIRVRLVFSLYQNVIDQTNSMMKFYCSTYSNNVNPVNDNNVHVMFRSYDFCKRYEDDPNEPETDEFGNAFYDPTRWMLYEFDTTVPEESGNPTRLKMEIQSSYPTSAFLFKEISFVTNPTGDPQQRIIKTYTPGLTSAISKIESLPYTINGNNVTFVENTKIYTITGALVNNAGANETITLNKGLYIAKTNGKSVKISIK
ncbi:hypothetical protein BSYN_17040 [Bacteroides sedimenti]|uniref:T9SS C-terminal target domain-containing protein n=2 Tax=Bacteroides sedimenti TaxID=2136147 RepID=A0ABN6Z5G7_9BACE